MRDQLTRIDYKKLDHIRGEMSRSAYLRMLIESRYNQLRNEWLEHMRLHRQIQYVKHILAAGGRPSDRKGENNETRIGQTER